MVVEALRLEGYNNSCMVYGAWFKVLRSVEASKLERMVSRSKSDCRRVVSTEVVGWDVGRIWMGNREKNEEGLFDGDGRLKQKMMLLEAFLKKMTALLCGFHIFLLPLHSDFTQGV